MSPFHRSSFYCLSLIRIRHMISPSQYSFSQPPLPLPNSLPRQANRWRESTRVSKVWRIVDWVDNARVISFVLSLFLLPDWNCISMTSKFPTVYYPFKYIHYYVHDSLYECILYALPLLAVKLRLVEAWQSRTSFLPRTMEYCVKLLLYNSLYTYSSYLLSLLPWPLTSFYRVNSSFFIIH